jgi:hypothetical protein
VHVPWKFSSPSGCIIAVYSPAQVPVRSPVFVTVTDKGIIVLPSANLGGPVGTRVTVKFPLTDVGGVAYATGRVVKSIKNNARIKVPVGNAREILIVFLSKSSPPNPTQSRLSIRENDSTYMSLGSLRRQSQSWKLLHESSCEVG